ncbi:BrnT family toxin [Acinetobacter bereziniae]|uniref:Uncharacterized protein n=1 Tax=Acinetobacter bereziniae NIPH 3 TaxID=1217651 RepID=N8X632_ACIBZ|nr:hypothetical protein [Acinetobacter bereziniae]ENV19827.1 hypothetical protein F963_04219 [Acinetobacter bereziniae NIPH 3]
MSDINIFDEIVEQNNLLITFINNYVLEKGKEIFFEIIKSKLQISKNRYDFIIKILRRDIKVDNFLMNDILRCIVKKLCESDDIDFFDTSKIPENHLLSKVSLYEYDPAKNGQNILKHGLDFGAVVNYGGSDYGRLISYTNSEIEDRFVIFSKYYVNNENNIFLSDDKKNEDFLCIATIATNVDIGFRFISSRALKVKNDKELQKELKNMIKDDNLDDSIMNGLRNTAYQILNEYYKPK